MKFVKTVSFIIAAIIILSLASYVYIEYSSSESQPINLGTMVNLTPELGKTFSPGSIQAFGANSSAILISGSGYYYKPSDLSTASLLRLSALNNTTQGTSLDSIANYYFHNGSVFGTGWNGSSWLLTGEITWGSVDEGSVISMVGDRVTNLTTSFAPYFKNGGVWFDAWNGSGWLLGGNNDKHASVVAYYKGEVINYTGYLGGVPYDSWVQLIAWNSGSWLLGGHSVFGFLKNRRYDNLLNATIFKSTGVYSAVSYGSEWVIGGGPPAGVEIVNSTSGQVTNLYSPFSSARWVNGLSPYLNGFVAGGESKGSVAGIAPLLYYFTIQGNSATFTNITNTLPSAFTFGQVQFLSEVSFKGVLGILIAGQGNYNYTTGYSSGALSLLELN